MISDTPDGAGYSFVPHRQRRFERRLETFLEEPTEEALEDLWCSEAVVAAQNPPVPVLLANFDGTEEFAEFLQTLNVADEYDESWENKLAWSWAL